MTRCNSSTHGECVGRRNVITTTATNSASSTSEFSQCFIVAGAPPTGPCLLVDDIRFSGWTLAMVGGQLRGKGAEAVYPLALATAF